MTGLTVLSFGAGQDSAAILAMYVHDATFRELHEGRHFIAVMSDTGAEHDDTYEYVDIVKERCATLGIPFFVLTGDMGYHSGHWRNGGLRGQWRATKTVGSIAYPSTCSIRLKIEPINRFLADYVRTTFGYSGKGYTSLTQFAADHGPIQVLIGYAKGEERRPSKIARALAPQQTSFAFPGSKPRRGPRIPKWQRIAIRMSYPLIERGFDRAACQTYLRAMGDIVPSPSQCKFCHWKTLPDLLLMAETDPEAWAEWVEFERAKVEAWGNEDFRRARQRPEKFKPNSAYKNHGVSGRGSFVDGKWKPVMLTDSLAEARRLFGHLTIEQLRARRHIEGHCIRSAAA